MARLPFCLIQRSWFNNPTRERGIEYATATSMSDPSLTRRVVKCPSLTRRVWINAVAIYATLAFRLVALPCMGFLVGLVRGVDV